MASMQCCKPTETASNQGHHDSSMGQKVSEVASWAFKSSSETKNQGTHRTMEQTECYTKTQGHYPEQGVAKTQTTHCHSQTQTHSPDHRMDQNKACGNGQTQTHHFMGRSQTHSSDGMAASACRGRTKKKGLFQRIKDGISGDSSSSDSESDDESCGKRKN